MSQKTVFSLYFEILESFKRSTRHLLGSSTAAMAKDLVNKTENLTHRQRVKIMVWLGMAAARKPCAERAVNTENQLLSDKVLESIAGALASMEAGDFSDRYLSLLACFGSYDGGRVERASSDKSRTVRALAVTLAPIVCDDNRMLSLLRSSRFETRQTLILALRKRKRVAVIDRYLALLREENEYEFSVLLPFASSDFVETHWSKAEEIWSDVDWARCARVHPEFSADKLIFRLKNAAAVYDPRLLLVSNVVLGVLSRVNSKLAISLAEVLLESYPAQKVNLTPLLYRLPNELAQLVLNRKDGTNLDFTPVLGRIHSDLVPEIFRRQLVRGGYTFQWLRRLPPSVRTELFQEFKDVWRDERACLPVLLLRNIPKQMRIEQARTHLNLASIAADRNIRLPYAQFLPWSELQEFLSPWLNDPDADARILAYGALVESIRFNRSFASELLDRLRGKKNEQDPVRFTWLSGLAQLPPGVWQESDLESLGAVIRDALDAKDLSYGSVAAVLRLVVKLVPNFPVWAAKWLAIVMKERVTVPVQLELQLNESQVRAVKDYLLPVLKSWQTREHQYQLIQIANSFGRRLEAFPELCALIAELTRKGSESSIRESSLRVLFQYRRNEFDQLIPELLNEDGTWAQRWPVSNYLHESRQDLLTPYLGQTAFKGAFGTGKIRIIPNYSSGFFRWSKNQRSIFCKSLIGMTEGHDRSTSDLFYALGRLCVVPDAPIEPLLKFSRAKEQERLAVRDYAIQCLSRMDAGEGLPELLQCLKDDRARVAIYSLGSSLEDINPIEALRIFRSVSPGRISVFKESIRLVGELKTAEAFSYLLDLDRSDLSRDCRIALLRAFWNYIEQNETWGVLSRAAKSGDKALAVYATRTPAQRISPKSEAKLVELLSEVLASSEPEVRLAVLNRCVLMPVSDREGLLFSGLSKSVGASDVTEYSKAALVIVTLYANGAPEKIAAVVSEIIDKRRNLSMFVSHLIGAVRWQPERIIPGVRAALQALASDNLTVMLQMQLAIGGLPWDEVETLLKTTVESGMMHAGVLHAAANALESASIRADLDQIQSLEKSFRSHDNELLRRLGLSALNARASGNRGWTAELIELLCFYRNDSSLLVSSAAQFIFPPGEVLAAAV